MRRFTPCMWFTDQALEAARHYVSLFRQSCITSVVEHGGPPQLPQGCVHAVAFELDGEPFFARNTGLPATRLPALSLVVHCDTQEEIDRFWDGLGAGGSERSGGWVHDRFGVRWQIVPSVFAIMATCGDAGRVQRVLDCMQAMRKPQIAALERVFAARGDDGLATTARSRSAPGAPPGRRSAVSACLESVEDSLRIEPSRSASTGAAEPR